ncbi:MAG: hypothetical protein DRP85_09490 [Candidatus Makaraimicrobium thalassicum]|nr:MAG: hypothetical protein DRP85_09490 [Candidatus Omnitrophota bacterium]
MGKYKSKFRDLKDGEPLTLPYHQAHGQKGVTFHFACCDCGLVHNVVILPLRTRVKIYFWRDNRRTANRRRALARQKASILMIP